MVWQFLCVFLLFFSCVQSIPYTYNNWRQNCFKAYGRAAKLDDDYIKYTYGYYFSHNLRQRCEDECNLKFVECKAYMIKTDSFSRDKNCFLYRIPFEDVIPKEIKYDDDYTIYYRTDCFGVQSRYDNNYRRRDRYDSFGRYSDERSKCYFLVKENRRINRRYHGDPLETNLDGCMNRCTNDLKCKGFNYRESSFGRDICELAYENTMLADINNFRVFTDDPGYDFYERKGYSGECQGRSPMYGNWGREDNYGYNTGFRNNYCLYAQSKSFSSTWMRLNRDRIRSSKSLQDCKDMCRNMGSRCQTLAFSPASRARSIISDQTRYPYQSSIWSAGTGECMMSRDDARTMEFKRDLSYSSETDVYERKSSCTGFGSNSLYGYVSGREGHTVTVDGQKCLEPCRISNNNNFYSCETSEGPSGNWNYCCHPDSVCELMHNQDTQGFIGCHVGAKKDQWRKCTNSVLGYRSGLMERGSAPDNVVGASESKGVNLAEDSEPSAGETVAHSMSFDVKNMTDLQLGG